VARITAASRSGIGVPAAGAPEAAAPAAAPRGAAARRRWPFLVGGVAILAAIAAAIALTRGGRPTEVATTALGPPATATPEATATPVEPAAPAGAPSPASAGASPSATPAGAPARPKAARALKPTPAPGVGAAPEPTPPPTPPPVVEGQLVEIGPGVTPPRKVSGPSAEYPERAKRQKLEGSVAISLLVDENGVPRDLTVVESAGPVLDEAVMNAVKDWRFEPATKDGVRVKIRWLVRQTYRRR
jgi:protein TonB